MTEYLLSMNQIVKQFPGTLALDHVDFKCSVSFKVRVAVGSSSIMILEPNTSVLAIETSC